MPLIDNWRIVNWWGAPCLLGKITGHPDPRVGIKPVSVTSGIVEYDFLNTVVTESGTQYRLGVPDESEDWLKQLEDMFK